MGRDDDATHTTLNGALVQVHPDLFFPHGKGRTCSLITFFFFNLLNCSCKFSSTHLFSSWSFSREFFLSAFMISVVLTIQLQLTLSGTGQGTFHLVSLLDQILSSEFFSNIPNSFGGEN